MLLRLILFLVWGFVGYLSLEFGSFLGSTPYFIHKFFYYKIASIPILKISYVFIELNFYRFLLVFLSSLILCVFSIFSVARIVSFLVFYNYSAIVSIYQFYLTDKWDGLTPGSTEYWLVASIPAFCFISVVIALLGCYVGRQIASYKDEKYARNTSASV